MPTLSLRKFDYETLKEKLPAKARILLISCNSCALQSDGLGGEASMSDLAERLAADGFEIVHRQLLQIACAPEMMSSMLEDDAIAPQLEGVDVVISLACEKGEDNAAVHLPDVHVLSVTETVGVGTWDEEQGASLVSPLPSLDINIEGETISLPEAARQLNLKSGKF